MAGLAVTTRVYCFRCQTGFAVSAVEGDSAGADYPALFAFVREHWHGRGRTLSSRASVLELDADGRTVLQTLGEG